ENCHSTRDRGASILRRFVPCSSRAFPASCHYSWRNPLPGDAPEADMACRGVDRLGMTRARPIAATVIGSAKMRTAFKHLTWNPDVRIARVEACGLGAAACRKLPFRFGRKILARPVRIGERVGIGDVHDRMTAEHVDVALRAVRMAPVGALHELPPSAPVAEIDGPHWRREHQRTGIEH